MDCLSEDQPGLNHGGNVNGIVADFQIFAMELIGRAAIRLISEVQNVNRFTMTFSMEPHVTIEWSDGSVLWSKIGWSSVLYTILFQR